MEKLHVFFFKTVFKSEVCSCYLGKRQCIILHNACTVKGSGKMLRWLGYISEWHPYRTPPTDPLCCSALCLCHRDMSPTGSGTPGSTAGPRTPWTCCCACSERSATSSHSEAVTPPSLFVPSERSWKEQTLVETKQLNGNGLFAHHAVAWLDEDC